MDVLWLLIKDALFRDNPPNPAYLPTQPAINRFISLYNADQPEIHDLVAQIRSVLDEYDDCVLVGEIYLPFARLVTYYGKDLNGAQLPFNFALLHTAWNAHEIAKLIVDYEKVLPLGGWPNWVLGNHDQPRIAARVGAEQARIAAMLLLTLRGTPTMYYGDELGIGRVAIAPELAKDPWEKNEPGLGVSRDPSRTPFQWDASANGGFTAGQPWLPVDPNYQRNNVVRLKDDNHSILQLHHRLIELRRQYLALSLGRARLVSVQDDVLIYERSYRGENIVIALNFGQDNSDISASELEGASLLFSTYMDHQFRTFELMLRANEGVILQRVL